MRRLSITALYATFALASSCGGPRPAAPDPREKRLVARPLEIYEQLGMLAGPPDFPAVARFATLAGAADSTLLVVTMSMPNRAVRFQRYEKGFTAEYRVTAVVLRDTQQVQQFERRESVSVGSFGETGRTEESIVFQDFLSLLPGRYIVRLQVADLNSTRGFRALDTVDVPAYARSAGLGTPLLVYEGSGRERLTDRPDIIVNTRNTIPYGDEGPHIYLEAYGAAAEQPVALKVVDSAGVSFWAGEAAMTQGSAQLRHALIDIPASALPLGKLWLEVARSPESQPQRLPLLVIISDQWMVANFEEVLRFLTYIAEPAQIDSLRKATPEQRRERWEKFWAVRDPLPATRTNEFREQFFERIRIASDEFAEPGRSGWETDRGEVFVVLGPPGGIIARQVGRDIGSAPNFLEWTYDSLPGGRLTLQFVDRNGFGHFELTQSSGSAFRSVAARMRPKS